MITNLRVKVSQSISDTIVYQHHASLITHQYDCACGYNINMIIQINDYKYKYKT